MTEEMALHEIMCILMIADSAYSVVFYIGILDVGKVANHHRIIICNDSYDFSLVIF